MLCLVNKLSNYDHQIKWVQSLISSSLSSLLPLLFLNLLPFLFYTDKLNPWAYHWYQSTVILLTVKKKMSFSDENLRMIDNLIDKLTQSLKQMEVDRKICEELRLDSQRLREEFRKRPYGESQAHNAFIPKRFEDLKLNGGIRLRRIPITLTYHKSRFKKRKRWQMRENCDPSVTQKHEISTNSLRLGVKSVGMKKQYHQKKRTTQVKLAQACKSLGMFQDSPSFRDPKDCTKICVVKRQIIDTGVRRETHLFWYEFTSHEPTDIDGHVDTRIGDQSIFAEEIKALKHDDPDAAMESLQDEISMSSESGRKSKCKSPVELSYAQHQSGQRRFHKVMFKVRLRRSYKVTAEKVRKDGNTFAQDADSLRVKRSWYLKRGVIWRCFHRARVKGLAHFSNEISLMRLDKGVMEVGTLQNHLTPHTRRDRVKKTHRKLHPKKKRLMHQICEDWVHEAC
ncbi:hypothetical protein Bca52824_065023 [Brassica carinata]|uniref:Uncharacterized protein n=1 Tax=Brassica carinata TaxID=52824 RepID=A0A8X7QMK0_BRACI|nr:hypothetical protein Bca52824_065023 [Brassica carinata]